MYSTNIAQNREQSATPLFSSDDRRHIRYTENAVNGQLLRVHYRVSRLSGRDEAYVFRHFCDANAHDRRLAEQDVAKMQNLDRMFDLYREHGCLFRKRWESDRRRWVEYVLLGTPVDDPLVQLELETMIDRSREVVFP